MRIAICSRARFTYVSQFIDAAAALARRHTVRYFLPWRDAAAVRLLETYDLDYEVVVDPPPAAAALSPAGAADAVDLFLHRFLPQAEAVVPSLIGALRAFAPDGAAVHLRDFAGMTALDALDVPWVSFGCFPSPVRDAAVDPPFGAGIGDGARPALRKLMWDMQRRLHARVDPAFHAQLREPLGLPAVSGVSTWASPRLVLSSLSPTFDTTQRKPRHMRFVGPLWTRRAVVMDAAERAALEAVAALPRPRVFVSLGTTYVTSALPRVLQALRAAGQAMVVAHGGRATGQGAPTHGELHHPFFTDVDAVLRQVDAVVSVGGGQTVMDALRHGVPLVCVPQQGEQGEITAIVAARGAGVSVSKRAPPADVATAVRRVTGDRSYRAAAQRIAQEIARCTGPEAAAKAVERALSR